MKTNLATKILSVTFLKGREVYEFRFTERTRAATVAKIGEYADNPELSLTWYDAAVLCSRVRMAE